MFKLLLLFILGATLQRAESFSQEQGLNLTSQSRAIRSRLPLGPRLPSNTVYLPYNGIAENVMLSTNKFYTRYTTERTCASLASRYGAHYWSYTNRLCYLATLFAPICRSLNANQQKIFILGKFLTDGSPDDDPFPNPDRTKELMHGETHFAFRVLTPTITEIPGFMKHVGHSWLKYAQRGKIFALIKTGGFGTFDDDILIDPSCHTNSSCGVPFLTTSVAAVTKPHIPLNQFCGQTIDLKDTPVLNVFSHSGIGCEFFPDVYPVPDCELTVTSCGLFTAQVTLVNFRKTTCEGYELKVVTFDKDSATEETDVCKKNAPTAFKSSGGKMQIKLSGSASGNWQRYGFIIKFQRFSLTIGSSGCSSGNSVLSSTSDLQVSTGGTNQILIPSLTPVQISTDRPERPDQIQTIRPGTEPTLERPGQILNIRPGTEPTPKRPDQIQTIRPGTEPTPERPDQIQTIRPAPPLAPEEPDQIQTIRPAPPLAPGEPDQIQTIRPAPPLPPGEPDQILTIRPGTEPTPERPDQIQTIRPGNEANPERPDQIQFIRPAPCSTESSDNNPAQTSTDGSDANLPVVSLISSIDVESPTEFFSDVIDGYKSGFPPVSPESLANLHPDLLLELGIELDEI